MKLKQIYNDDVNEGIFLWEYYYLLLFSYFFSAGYLDGITAETGVMVQPADWDYYC